MPLYLCLANTANRQVLNVARNHIPMSRMHNRRTTIFQMNNWKRKIRMIGSMISQQRRRQLDISQDFMITKA